MATTKGQPAPPTGDEISSDIPILPVAESDSWEYEVCIQIPAGVTSPGSEEVQRKYARIRTYLGKISAVEGLPKVDWFEVTEPNRTAEREFVEISEDKVRMRGSMMMRPQITRPMGLNYPILFVFAGIKPGTESLKIQAAGGILSRKTQVLAREYIVVPAGKFPSTKLLMTGSDGDLELRRTIWFAPGIGIVREEKTRFRKGRVIFNEIQALIKLNLKVGKR